MTRSAFPGFARRLLPITAALGVALFAPVAGFAEQAPSAFALAGFSEVRVDAALRLPAWERLVPRLGIEERSLQDCRVDGRCVGPEIKALSAFLDEQRNRPPLAQLRAVNAFVNARPYAADTEQFGIRDVWQSPLAFVAAGGDCEDYAVAKYLVLRQLGFPDNRLRIVVGIDEARDQPHAVVVVSRQNGLGLVVLDNRSDEVMEGRSFAGFHPKYAVTITGRWAYAPIAATTERTVIAGASERP